MKLQEKWDIFQILTLDFEQFFVKKLIFKKNGAQKQFFFVTPNALFEISVTKPLHFLFLM